MAVDDPVLYGSCHTMYAAVWQERFFYWPALDRPGSQIAVDLFQVE